MTTKATFDARRKAGVCLTCAIVKVEETVRCAGCLEKANVSKNKTKKKYKDAGKCEHCGKDKMPNRTLCRDCAERKLVNTRKRKKRNKEAGICNSCGKQPKYETVSVCEECWYKVVAKRHLGTNSAAPLLKNLWLAQQGMCAYSDEILKIGVNVELDHKIPKSRNGGNQIDNFQWVTEEINALKGTQTHEEFIRGLPRLIVKLQNIVDKFQNFLAP